MDQDGDIYVADWMNNRVQVLSPEGRFIAEVRGDHVLSQWGKAKLAANPDMVKQRAVAMAWDPTWEKLFAPPCAVKVDDQNRIAVIDHTNARIQVYVKRTTPVLV